METPDPVVNRQNLSETDCWRKYLQKSLQNLVPGSHPFWNTEMNWKKVTHCYTVECVYAFVDNSLLFYKLNITFQNV